MHGPSGCSGPDIGELFIRYRDNCSDWGFIADSRATLSGSFFREIEGLGIHSVDCQREYVFAP